MSTTAQLTMRQKYLNGAPGVIFSGFVWLFAALVTNHTDFLTGAMAFLVGGMLIHPASVLISNMLNKNAPQPDEGLSKLAILTLPILFSGLFLAWMLTLSGHELFYPVVAIAVGIRYLFFKLIYGQDLFTLLGILLAALGAAGYFLKLPMIEVPIYVGLSELIIGVLLALTAKQVVRA